MNIKNWKTTVAGILVFFAVNGESLGVPDKVQRVLEGITIAAGFAVCRDHDK